MDINCRPGSIVRPRQRDALCSTRIPLTNDQRSPYLTLCSLSKAASLFYKFKLRHSKRFKSVLFGTSPASLVVQKLTKNEIDKDSPIEIVSTRNWPIETA